MIIGIGNDLIEIARIAKVIDRHGANFLAHVFTAAEQAAAPVLSSSANAIYYAGRWAAKEAIAKALGTGIGENCRWHDLQIERLPGGKPRATLHGAAARTAAQLGVTSIHISISHERSIASAVAILEQHQANSTKVIET